MSFKILNIGSGGTKILKNTSNKLSPLTLSNNLSAYYNFDTNYNDSSSNNINLTNYSSTLSGGFAGSAVAISTGNGNYLKTTASNFNVGTGDISFSIWIYAYSYGSGGFSNLAGTMLDFRTNSSDVWDWVLSTTGKLILWNNVAVYTSNTTIQLNKWTNIIVVRNSGKTSVYFNGVLDTNSPFADTSNITSTNFTIGGDATNNTALGSYLHFNGLIDELGIWGRALTNLEVSSLYNKGSGNIFNTNKINFLSNYPLNTLVTYVLVAGGGGGINAVHNGVGGAGAGAVLTGVMSVPLSTAIGITVGAGGAAGSNGSNSILNNITAFGGGQPGAYQAAGGVGGCGAGASRDSAKGGGIGIQGGNGGSQISNSYASAGGGGGAGGNGFPGYPDGPAIYAYAGYISSGIFPAQGGAGILNPISGSTLGQATGSNPVKYWVGGGGGGAFFNNSYDDPVNFPKGGIGGGGNGASSNGVLNGTNGLTNTGGGAGAAINKTGLNGGSGGIALAIPVIHTVSFSAGVTFSLETTTNFFKIYKITATSTTAETITIT